jgi:hypothetical protein
VALGALTLTIPKIGNVIYVKPSSRPSFVEYRNRREAELLAPARVRGLEKHAENRVQPEVRK